MGQKHHPRPLKHLLVAVEKVQPLKHPQHCSSGFGGKSYSQGCSGRVAYYQKVRLKAWHKKHRCSRREKRKKQSFFSSASDSRQLGDYQIVLCPKQNLIKESLSSLRLTDRGKQRLPLQALRQSLHPQSQNQAFVLLRLRNLWQLLLLFRKSQWLLWNTETDLYYLPVLEPKS